LWPLLVALGVVGVGGFYLALVKAVELAGVALAVVLMYTAPAWTTLGGVLFLHETFSGRKLLALALALSGAALAAKVYDPTFIQLSLPGVLAGLSAGVGYALFSIFTKLSVGKIDPRTLSLYGFGIGALALLPFQGLGLTAALQPGAWPLLVGMVAGPTLGSWALFSRGLRDVAVSNATIVASIEPVIANLLAFVMFGEILAPLQLAGGALILTAVIVLQTETK
jgi:DME family drug/metabolite transporter